MIMVTSVDAGFMVAVLFCAKNQAVVVHVQTGFEQL